MARPSPMACPHQSTTSTRSCRTRGTHPGGRSSWPCPCTFPSLCLVGCAISTLGALGLLACAENVHRSPSCPHAQFLCPTVFWLVLFLHSDLVPRLFSREHHIFLDKVCIHQTDTKGGHRTLERVPPLQWTTGGFAGRRPPGAAVDSV